MHVEPDGPEGQSEVRRYIQPTPEWDTQAGEEPTSGEWAGAWGIVRAAMVAGLDHREVGLGPSRVADGFMELEAYERRGDSYRDDEQLDEDLDVLFKDLMDFGAGARNLQESLRDAMPQAAESRDFMHQVMELGFKAGEGDELSLEGVKQEV